MHFAVQARLLGSLLLLGTVDAFALGLGRVSTLSHLGNPLELSVGISAELRDGLTAECVSAEVFVGEQRLPNELVRLRINRAADGTPISVRLVTGTRIDEPVASVTLMLGCPTSVTRRYVVFIDPPALSLAQAGGADATGEIEAAETAPGAAEGRSGRSAAVRSRTDVAVVAAAPQPPGDAGGDRDAALPSRAPGEEGGRRAAQAARNRRLAATPAAPASAAAPRRIVAEPGARLRLESAPALQGGSPAREQSAQSRSGAAPAAVSASAIAELTAQVTANSLALDQERLRALEERFRRLRSDNDATRRTVAELESGLKAAQSERVDKRVVYALAAAVALLLLALLVTLMRLLSRRSSAAWATGDSAIPDESERADVEQPSPAPARDAVRNFAPLQAQLSEPLPADPVVDDADSAWPAAGAAPERSNVAPRAPDDGADVGASTDHIPVDHPQTMPGPAYGTAANSAVPDQAGLPIDELIDLEQQVDFFLVLGQHDAAVELLTAHVQTTGDASPLPYLKLLDIYRRNGEQTAYTRTRERFNRRFGASAPEWEDEPVEGSPVDENPEIVHRLQVAWPEPAKALELIESLLFRRDPSVAEFDLPAYGELLFLYSLARDLSEREVPQNEVDLLLPIEGGAAVPPSFNLDLMLDAPVEEAPASAPAVLDFNLRLLDAPIIPPSIAASTEPPIEGDTPRPSRSAG